MTINLFTTDHSQKIVNIDIRKYWFNESNQREGSSWDKFENDKFNYTLFVIYLYA